MTKAIHSIDNPSNTESLCPLTGTTRVNILASVIEHLTEHRVNEDRSLAEQANWLAVQIDEHSDDLQKVTLLAGIGLNLSQGRQEEDDMLGEELFFLFGEISEAVQETREPRH